MNIDVLMHAALRRLGPVKLEWVRPAKVFRVTCDGFTVESPSWPELWERFILEAVARR
jgi:hypothetical protein